MIEAVHKLGFLHRDRSDSSIVLYRSEKGGRREAYLIDWDYATRVSDNCDGDAREYLQRVRTLKQTISAPSLNIITACAGHPSFHVGLLSDLD